MSQSVHASMDSAALRTITLDHRQYFVAASAVPGGGVQVALTDGADSWSGTLPASELTPPNRMDAADYARRLRDGLLGRASAVGDHLELELVPPSERKLVWRASVQHTGPLPLRFALSQARTASLHGRAAAPRRAHLSRRGVAGDPAACGRVTRRDSAGDGGAFGPTRERTAGGSGGRRRGGAPAGGRGGTGPRPARRRLVRPSRGGSRGTPAPTHGPVASAPSQPSPSTLAQARKAMMEALNRIKLRCSRLDAALERYERGGDSFGALSEAEGSPSESDHESGGGAARREGVRGGGAGSLKRPASCTGQTSNKRPATLANETAAAAASPADLAMSESLADML